MWFCVRFRLSCRRARSDGQRNGVINEILQLCGKFRYTVEQVSADRRLTQWFDPRARQGAKQTMPSSVNMGTFRLPEEKKHKCISPKPRQPLVAALVGAIFVVLGHAIFWPCFRKAFVAIIYCRLFW